jgi:hypothetical protein
MIQRFGIVNSIIALIGVLSLGYLVYQIWYGLNATPGTAVVQSYEAKRRFQGSAVVAYQLEGKPVEARLRVWLLPLEQDQQVAILYRPERPEVVQLDSFWQRYAPPLGAVLFAGAVVGWEVLRRLKPGSAGQMAAGSRGGRAG